MPNRPIFIGGECTLPILPADDISEMSGRVERVDEHDAQPVTSKEDIHRMVEYLLEHERWRDAMLLVVGINTGLRYSDLTSLRFMDIIDENCRFIEDVALVEKKTRNTKGRKKGSKSPPRPHNRHLYLNESIRKIVRIYLEHVPSKLSDFMFKNMSNSGWNAQKGLSHTSVDNIFKRLTAELSIEGRFSTHFLRKTFSYHLLMSACPVTEIGNRKAEWLQMTLRHSNIQTTLKYAGFMDREVKNFYKNLNLGLDAIDEFLGVSHKEETEVVSLWA